MSKPPKKAKNRGIWKWVAIATLTIGIGSGAGAALTLGSAAFTSVRNEAPPQTVPTDTPRKMAADDLPLSELTIENMATRLALVRDDGNLRAMQVPEAARIVTTHLADVSDADAESAAFIIVAEPGFVGDSTQLASLVAWAHSFAQMSGLTLTQGAKVAAGIIRDPAASAQFLVGRFPGVTQAFADEIASKATSGHKAEAAGELLGIVPSPQV